MSCRIAAASCSGSRPAAQPTLSYGSAVGPGVHTETTVSSALCDLASFAAQRSANLLEAEPSIPTTTLLHPLVEVFGLSMFPSSVWGGRTTATVQGECRRSSRLTEPSSLPATPPRPRAPTTTRSACLDCSVKILAGSPSAATVWTAICGSLATASVTRLYLTPARRPRIRRHDSQSC